jgi:hypothetical protein
VRELGMDVSGATELNGIYEGALARVGRKEAADAR